MNVLELIWAIVLRLIAIILFAIGAIIGIILFLVVFLVALILFIPTLILLALYLSARYLWWKATRKEERPPEFAH